MPESNSISDGSEPLPRTLSCDVAVVGYGPVGMATSALLAQHGHAVVVVEKHFESYHLSRAGHFDGETMRMFQRLGIAQKLELDAQAVSQYALLDKSMNVLQDISAGESGCGWKASYLCPSTRTEALLDERARQLGVRVFMGLTAETVAEHDGGVHLVARRSAGGPGSEAVTITARYVVGADGAKSDIRTLIGARRQDLGFKPWENLVVDFEQADPDRDYPRLKGNYQLLDWKRPTQVGRWGGNRWTRFEWAKLDDEPREHLEREETVWNLLAQWDVFPADGKIVRKAFYTFEASLVDTWRKGRVFLVGDAAHTMPPFLGQGMCSGLRDALNLSWKLAAVLAGEADARLLDTYELERKHHVAALTHMAIGVGQLALVTDEDAARKRDEMLRSGASPPMPPFPKLVAGLISPRGDAVPTVGRLAPQARVCHRNRIGLLDDFCEPGRWRVVSRHPLPLAKLDAGLAQVLSTIHADVVHVSRGALPDSDSYRDMDGEFTTWFESTGQTAFIQRPDNYIFGTSETMEDLPALLDQLRQVLLSSGWAEL